MHRGYIPVELSSIAEGNGGFAIYGEAAKDNSGIAVDGISDLNSDGLDEILVGAPGVDRNRLVIDSGKTYVVFGKTDTQAIELQSIAEAKPVRGFTINASDEEDQSSGQVSRASDVNGDGIEDFVLGAVGVNQGRATRAGAAYVVYGKKSARPVNLWIRGNWGFAIRGATRFGELGRSVSGAGDMNGDGLADVVVSAHQEQEGRVYVVFGAREGQTVTTDELAAGSSAGFTILQRNGKHLGHSVSSAGDVNGDGLDDIVITATTNGRIEAPFPGGVYVVFGRRDASTVDISDPTTAYGFAVLGEASSNRVEYKKVHGGGDVNGDGLDDIVLGTSAGSEDIGDIEETVCVVFGKANHSTVNVAGLADRREGFVISGFRSKEFFGKVKIAGDINEDGFADILVGAHKATVHDKKLAGQTYVVFGKKNVKPVRREHLERGRGGFVINGADANHWSGVSFADAGDINGDSHADVVIGAHIARNSAGATYVVFGGPYLQRQSGYAAFRSWITHLDRRKR